MAKIQIDLSDEENKNVEIYKVKHNLLTKQEAIKKMIHKFDVNVNFPQIQKNKLARLMG